MSPVVAVRGGERSISATSGAWWPTTSTASQVVDTMPMTSMPSSSSRAAERPSATMAWSSPMTTVVWAMVPFERSQSGSDCNTVGQRRHWARSLEMACLLFLGRTCQLPSMGRGGRLAVLVVRHLMALPLVDRARVPKDKSAASGARYKNFEEMASPAGCGRE